MTHVAPNTSGLFERAPRFLPPPRTLDGFIEPGLPLRVSLPDYTPEPLYAVCLRSMPAPVTGTYEIVTRYGGVAVEEEVPLSAISLDPCVPAVQDHVFRTLVVPWFRARQRSIPDFLRFAEKPHSWRHAALAASFLSGAGVLTLYDHPWGVRCPESSEPSLSRFGPVGVRVDVEGAQPIAGHSRPGWFVPAENRNPTVCGPEVGAAGAYLADVELVRRMTALVDTCENHPQQGDGMVIPWGQSTYMNYTPADGACPWARYWSRE